MPPTDTRIGHWADLIIAAIDDDIAEGALPASVRSFTDLHDYLDANDYLQDAGVPFDATTATTATIDLTVRVQEEVNHRLQAPGRLWCTFGACRYPKHDHTTTTGDDGAQLPEPVAMRCQHCGHAAHYDEKLRWYRHDDPAVADCFLIQRDNHA
jgi:hypothetical protein